MKLKLHWQILIAMALAWLFHLVVGEGSRIVEPLGVVFIRLLKMIIIPLVVLSIITGVAGVGDSKKLGRQPF
jgi:Na+/H+-dicarboxylate symporter